MVAHTVRIVGIAQEPGALFSPLRTRKISEFVSWACCLSSALLRPFQPRLLAVGGVHSPCARGFGDEEATGVAAGAPGALSEGFLATAADFLRIGMGVVGGLILVRIKTADCALGT